MHIFLQSTSPDAYHSHIVLVSSLLSCVIITCVHHVSAELVGFSSNTLTTMTRTVSEQCSLDELWTLCFITLILQKVKQKSCVQLLRNTQTSHRQANKTGLTASLVVDDVHTGQIVSCDGCVQA